MQILSTTLLNTLSPYHVCPKILTNPFYYLWMCLKSTILMSTHHTLLCPHLPKIGVGHITFRRDVTHNRDQSLSCSWVRAYDTFLKSHNLGTVYARKL